MSIIVFAQSVVREMSTSNAKIVYRALPDGYDYLNVGASFMLPTDVLSNFSLAGLALDISYLYPITQM